MSGHISDEHALQDVGKQVQNNIQLVRKLTGREKSHDVGKSQKLPLQELQQARGIAFFESTKAGVIFTGVTGKGFLIQKLPNHQWSAPVVFTLKSVGFGASIGFSTSHTLLVLDNEKAVHDFLHTQVSLDSDMTVAAGKAGRHMHDSELNVTHPGDSFQGAAYSVAEGAMISVAFHGVKVSVNEKEMQKLYGSGVDDKLVLNGSQPQLPILEPLITEIETILHSKDMSGTTTRDFTAGDPKHGVVHRNEGNLGGQIKDTVYRH